MAARKTKAPEPEVTTIRDALADLKRRGFDARLVWGADQEGNRYGPVPADWDAPFKEDV